MGIVRLVISKALLFHFLFFPLAALLLASPFVTSASAERIISFEKTLDVPKGEMKLLLTDIGNYPKIFPEYIRSAKLIENSDKHIVAEMTLGVSGFFITAKVLSSQPRDDQYELRVISGDLRGTRMITTMEKTWGYDGTPDMGTKVKVEVSPHMLGFLALLGLVSEDVITYSIDKSLYTLAQYYKK